jgi:hypothetical protein
LSTKLLSTKLTSAPLTKRRACVVPLKHGANRDQSKTEGNRYHVDEFTVLSILPLATRTFESPASCDDSEWITGRLVKNGQRAGRGM